MFYFLRLIRSKLYDSLKIMSKEYFNFETNAVFTYTHAHAIKYRFKGTEIKIYLSDARSKTRQSCVNNFQFDVN